MGNGSFVVVTSFVASRLSVHSTHQPAVTAFITLVGAQASDLCKEESAREKL